MNFKLLILTFFLLLCANCLHLNREEHSANATVCTPPSYFNATSQNCTQCLNGTQYNISTKNCQPIPCPGNQIYNNTKLACACPNNAPFQYNNTCNQCDEGSYFNKSSGVCSTCGPDKTYDTVKQNCTSCDESKGFFWNSKICVQCVHPYYFDFKNYTCSKCSGNQTFNINTQKC